MADSFQLSSSLRYVKIAVILGTVWWVCIILSPLLVSVLIPLLVILIGSLLVDAQSTVSVMLRAYHKWNVFKIRFLYNSTPQNMAHDRLISGQAWSDFCDTLKTASSAISAGPLDPLSQSEGYRYLARVTRAALASFLEYADPDVPQLHSLIGETIKMGADNPDNLYQSAPLLHTISYKLKGVRGTVKYLSIGTQKGHYGKRAGLPPIAFVDASQLKYFAKTPSEFVQKYDIDDDAATAASNKYFEIVISATQPSPQVLNANNWNWLKLDDEEDGTLIVRQTFGLRENEKQAILCLERFDFDAECGLDEEEKRSVQADTKSFPQPQPLAPKTVDDALQSAASLVCGAGLMFSRWAEKMRSDPQVVNRLPVVQDQSAYRNAGGDPNIFYYHSYYELEPNEALVITANMPEKCLFWNFQLNNHWMESLDYVHFQIHVNSDRAQYNFKDGQKYVVIVVSHDDHVNKMDALPEPYSKFKVNWLSTAHHDKGTMLFRWLCAEQFEHPSTALIKLNVSA